MAGFARFNTSLYADDETYGLTVYQCRVVGQNFKERHRLPSRRMLGASVTYSHGVAEPDVPVAFKCRFGDSSTASFVDLWNSMVQAENAGETRVYL